jgi:hypothetical protein
MQIEEMRMLDVNAPNIVQFEVSADGKMVYVHADGVTLLRAGRVGEVVITDHRETSTNKHCGRPWVAEIELCPRCGMDAGAHVGL